MGSLAAASAGTLLVCWLIAGTAVVAGAQSLGQVAAEERKRRAHSLRMAQAYANEDLACYAALGQPAVARVPYVSERVRFPSYAPELTAPERRPSEPPAAPAPEPEWPESTETFAEKRQPEPPAAATTAASPPWPPAPEPLVSPGTIVISCQDSDGNANINPPPGVDRCGEIVIQAEHGKVERTGQPCRFRNRTPIPGWDG